MTKKILMYDRELYIPQLAKALNGARSDVFYQVILQLARMRGSDGRPLWAAERFEGDEMSTLREAIALLLDDLDHPTTYKKFPGLYYKPKRKKKLKLRLLNVDGEEEDVGE